MTLTECAERLGVAVDFCRCPCEAAHQVLEKLPPRFDEGDEVWGLFFVGDSRWAWYWERTLGDDPSGATSFEECVTALAERYFASADS